MEYSLGELADAVGGRVHGTRDTRVHGVAPLYRAQPGMIAFLADASQRAALRTTCASAVILTDVDLPQCPVDALVTDNPHLAYARIAALLAPDRRDIAGRDEAAVVAEAASVSASASIGAGAVVEASAVIGAGCRIGPGCVIGEGVCIGADTRLVANVTVCSGSRLGERCLVKPGAVVGADGFGFARDGNRWVKVPQLGGVSIGDDVEIGANTTIDRGALDDTIIEDGVKLDNQIQVAHNVRIGENTAIAGCAAIAGSTRVGRNCTIGGGAGIVGHIELVDDVHITAMSFITQSIDRPGVYSSGTPFEENRRWRRNYARFRYLDDMWQRLKALERRLGDKRAQKKGAKS